MSRFVARKSTRLTMYMTAIALVVSSVYMVVLSTLAGASLVTNAYPGAAYSWGNDLGRQLGDGLPLGTVVTDPSQAVGIVGADAIAAFGVGTYAHTPSGWSVWGRRKQWRVSAKRHEPAELLAGDLGEFRPQ